MKFIRGLLCWLGIHRPDEDNKTLIEFDRWGNPVYASKCLECHCDMKQVTL